MPPAQDLSTSESRTNGVSTKLSEANDSDQFLYSPLTKEEIENVRDTVVHHLLEEHDIRNPRFSYITLHEQSTTKKQRIAEVVVHSPPTTPHMIRVRLASHCTTNNTCITSDRQLPCDVQPVLTPDDCLLAERIAMGNEALKKELISAYGEQFEMERLVCDPWSVHMADSKIGEQNLEDEEHCCYDNKRLVQLFLYYKNGSEKPDDDEWNHYSHPLHLVPVVDLLTKTLVSIHGTNRPKSSIPPIPSTINNYHDTTKKQNTDKNVEQPLPLKPIEIKQPEGVSFEINEETNEISWYHWKMNISYNFREGIVLHNIQYMNRPILKRISLVEMAVPYGDKNEPFQKKCAFDIGDYGLGYCTQSLNLGCDCLGVIKYLPLILNDINGNPFEIKNGICIHEEDDGILYKHVEYRTNKSFVKRNRKLIISFISTIVNYEYLFYFYFKLDGTFGLDIKLSGMLSTNLISSNEFEENDKMPLYGTLVSPNVNAQIHQHMFCCRIEPTIDGKLNRAYEMNVEEAKNEEYGNGFRINETLIENEQMNFNDNRTVNKNKYWRITNNTTPYNKISKKPVAYKLMIESNRDNLLTSEDSVVSKRARFAKNPLWVTKYNSNENFPAGDFPTQTKGFNNNGIDQWIKTRNQSLVDTNLVLWCSFGLLHLPRVEDFPIMPCETTGIIFKPDGFFHSSPTLDLPSSSPHATEQNSCC